MIKDPLLSRTLNDRLEKICQALGPAYLSEYEDYSLFSGKAGIALFFFYYGRYRKDDQAFQIGKNLIEQCIEEISKGNIGPVYADGLAGIGWGLEHLIQEGFISFDDEKGLKALDDVTLELMDQALEEGFYDFLHGGTGYANYLYLRSKRARIDGFPELLVRGLKKTAKENNDGSIEWLSELEGHQEKVVNLGLAHGLPAIVIMLSKLYEVFKTSEIKRIAGGCMKTIMKNRQDPDLFRSCYPSWVNQGNPAHSRLAWCYGDPGIYLAFYHSCNTFPNDDWTGEMRNIAECIAKRGNSEFDMVYDAGLCHGTAGILHIINRHNIVGSGDRNGSALRFWAEKTMEMAKFDDGLANFKALRSLEKNIWVSEPGLLEGIAGIGLVLISLLSPIVPAWDECLLIS